ncbi:MAG: DUF2911 domain-containing protein [Saprospiraceae bacterium]|nr:DUF2911 domain-containing protein [Saprospiraceae bacterium]
MKTFTTISLLILIATTIWSQALRIPDNTNLSNTIGRELGITQIEVKYNAPAVRDREGQIWGTTIVPFGYIVLGYGSDKLSPWRAGADESTTISFSTEVLINGEKLAAGEYGFFIAVYEDSCTLIFNKNTNGWGSYFYNKDLDILHVSTKPQKNVGPMKERLEYTFSDQTDDSVILSLEWEHWRIPMTISVDKKSTILEDIVKQLSGALGFDPPSLQAGARWCLLNNLNHEQALSWINTVISPTLGGQNTFGALNIKSGLLEKMGQSNEAQEIKALAIENATVFELHQYGKELLAENKKEKAFQIFELNYKKFNGFWPTNVGMLRMHSASQNYPMALEFAKKALTQAPDDLNKNALEVMILKLQEGKDIN